MLGLFFDVQPKPGHMQAYFDHVARLKPVLARHRGLLFLDRYRPVDAPEALLSHQLWADAAAIEAWRADPDHKISQSAGRRVHFDSYRIRVGAQAPDGPQDAPGRFLVAAYGPAPVALPDARVHKSVTRNGHYLTLTSTTRAAAAQGRASTARDAGAKAVRVFVLDRDYTMKDRTEAPRRPPSSFPKYAYPAR